MYSLRFYLDDNDIVAKCEYKRVSTSKNIDVMFYNDIHLGPNDLLTAFNFLAKNDKNHKYKVGQRFVVHEFIVPESIIRDMLQREEKRNQAIQKRKQEMQKKTTTKIKPTTTKPQNRKVVRENKVKGKVVISIVGLLVLATVINIVIDKTKDKNIDIIDPKPVIEYSVENFEEETNFVEQPEIQEINETEKEYYEPTNQYAYMIEQENAPDYTLNLITEDWTGTSKYRNCYNNYHETIEKYSKMYGIDSNVALAIACHERGEHSDEMDAGGGLGLYQIQIGVWEGSDVRAYNFETESWETYTIREENVKNVEDNIKAGIMIFQECLRRNDYNLVMAVQEYNFGHNGLMRTMSAASESLGISVEDLEKIGNTDWLDYRTENRSNGYQMGDPKYIENVFKYITDDQELHFTTPDYEHINIKFNNLNYTHNDFTYL